jgi:HupE / UreJ protein
MAMANHTMAELSTYIQLGFGHIVNREALDHILFLLALAAIYRRQDWRDALWVMTAFTVGHSVTLVLAASGALVLPIRWIEFLIPVTIVMTAASNVFTHAIEGAAGPTRWRAGFAALFGLVHGAGFAEYLQSLFMDHIVVPLFGFNIGIELGQIVVLVAAGAALTALDSALRRGVVWSRWTPLRMRITAVSCLVLLLGCRMVAERLPW